jgi:hypothetical protein
MKEDEIVGVGVGIRKREMHTLRQENLKGRVGLKSQDL